MNPRPQGKRLQTVVPYWVRNTYSYLWPCPTHPLTASPPPPIPMPKSDSDRDSARTAVSKHWQGLIPPWILCCLVVAAILIPVSIGVGWHLGVSELEGSSPRPSAQRSVLFTLDLVGLDPLQNIITLDWWIVGDDCIPSNSSSAESTLPCPVVNIYVNPCVFGTWYFRGKYLMTRTIQHAIFRL